MNREKGEKLVNRISKDELRKVQEKYMNDPLYRAMRPALSAEHDKYELLSPAEMWKEARFYCKKVWDSKYPVDEIGVCYDCIKEDYYGLVRKKDPFDSLFNPENDNGLVASEVLWCMYAMLSTLYTDSQQAINKILCHYLESADIKAADAAVKEAYKTEGFTPLSSFLDSLHACKSGSDAHQPKEELNNSEKDIELRCHGVQMMPLLEMMRRLWGPLRLSYLSRREKAILLSIISGFSEDALYNKMKAEDDKSPYELSEKWHSNDVARINDFLPRMNVMRPIKVSTKKK